MDHRSHQTCHDPGGVAHEQQGRVSIYECFQLANHMCTPIGTQVGQSAMGQRLRPGPLLLQRLRHWTSEVLVVAIDVLLALWAQVWFASRRAATRTTIARRSRSSIGCSTARS
jgi:hypothetical protein